MSDYKHRGCDRALIDGLPEAACNACRDPKTALGITDPAAALRAPLHQPPDAEGERGLIPMQAPDADDQPSVADRKETSE